MFTLHETTKQRSSVITEIHFGLHSYGFSDQVRTSCFLCSTDGGEDQMGKYRRKRRNIALLKAELWRTIFFTQNFSLCLLFISFSSFFFMTDSRTTWPKNPGVWGSNRSCTACQEKTWGTWNPEGDLKTAKVRQQSYLSYAACTQDIFTNTPSNGQQILKSFHNLLETVIHPVLYHRRGVGKICELSTIVQLNRGTVQDTTSGHYGEKQQRLPLPPSNYL